jgi:hypothetical protein
MELPNSVIGAAFTMRPIQASDIDTLAAMWSDTEVTRFLPSRGVPIPNEKTCTGAHKFYRTLGKVQLRNLGNRGK